MIEEEMLCVVKPLNMHNPSTSMDNMEVVDRLEND